jgi:hypothetical protein
MHASLGTPALSPSVIPAEAGIHLPPGDDMIRIERIERILPMDSSLQSISEIR